MYVRLLLALLCVLGCATLVEASPFAYVAIYNGQRVAVVDTSSNSKIKDILLPTSVNPYGVAVNNFGSRVYVSDRMGTKIFVIDTSDDSIQTFNVPYRSSGLAVNAAGTRLYVAHPENASVSVLDALTGTVLNTVSAGTAPQGVAVNPAGDRVYVANSALGPGDTNHYVSVFNAVGDAMTGAGTATVDSTPMGIALNPTGTRLYVACSDSGTVNVIDTSNPNLPTVGTVNVGTIPFGVAVNPAGTLAYVTLSGTDDKVAIIDTSNNQPLGTKISVGRSPMGISITPDGARIVAANSLAASAALINPSNNAVVTVSVEKTAGDNSNPQSLGNFVGPELVPITFPVPFNGTVTPADPITVDPLTYVALAPKGKDFSFNVTPDVNFIVGSVMVDDTTTLTPPYKLGNVQVPHSISATFTRVSRTVTVKKADLNSGTGRVWTTAPASPSIDCGTTCTEASRNYNNYVTITLVAQADPGSMFQGWGARCGGSADCTFTTDGVYTDIAGNYTVEAYFTKSQDTSFQALYDGAAAGSTITPIATYLNEPTTSFVAGTAKTITISPSSPSTTVKPPAAFTIQYGTIVIGTGGTFIIQ